MEAWLTVETHFYPLCDYHTKFGRSSSNRVSVGRGSIYLGTLGPLPFKWGAADLKARSSPQFGRSIGLNVYAYVGVPKVFGTLGSRPLGWGVADP